MTGLLDRFLNGTGTDPLNQAGGLEGYLNQFNVNQRYMPWMQAGNQFDVTSTATGNGGLLDGKLNPYEVQPAAPTQQQPASKPTGPITISALLGASDEAMRNGVGVLGTHNGKGAATTAALSNGQVMSMADLLKKVRDAGLVQPGTENRDLMGLDLTSLLGG